MIGLRQTWNRCKNLIETVEHYYEDAQERGSDDVLEVLLPAAYQHLSRHDDLVPDQQLFMLAGQYFASKYPHLKDDFINERQRESLAQTESALIPLLGEREERPYGQED